MKELVLALQESGFQVYITTGGGRDFVRAVCEEIYNIPRSMTIGSSVTFEFKKDSQGAAQVLRTKELEMPIDDGPGKPPHIHRAIGRRPVLAAGNSDGDIPMLQVRRRAQGRTLGFWCTTTTPDREYAYDEGAETALQLAAERGLAGRQHEGRLEDGFWLVPDYAAPFRLEKSRRSRCFSCLSI